jgi:hypothetical protein
MRIASRAFLASVSIACLASWIAREHWIVRADQRKPVTLMRLYTGPDGQSYTEQVEVKFAPAADAPSVDESRHIKAASTYAVRVPPGFYSSWHNADKRRYIVPISGQAEIEVAGGQKITIRPGQIGMAEDLTGKGHTFRVVGNEDWVALFVDFEQ